MATALAVRYVLAGIIESRDRKVAVTLDHTDTTSREIIWAGRIESPVKGIDDVRSQIVTLLVSALETYIPFNEARNARLHGPDGLDA